MSLQAIWIVQTPKRGSKSNAEVVFSRWYQPFIKKSKLLSGDSYVPIPANPDFAKAICHELALMDQKGSDLYVCERDSCRQVQEKPVYEVNTGAGKLWPLVIVEQPQLLFCCLPFVPQSLNPKPPLIDIPGVTVGFTLLCALMDFLRNTAPNEVEQRTSDLYAFLSHAAPYGSVVDTSVDSVLAKVSNKFTAASKSLKQPSWRSASHRGKNQMYLAITEHVRSTQYDRENVEDVWEVYGTVTCKAELEGHTPTVTMTISQATEGEVTPINHLLIHPCVQSADAYILEEGRDRAIPRRLRFTPPLEMFTLCHYTAEKPSRPPITGSFEMFVEEDRAKVKASLQLSEAVKNNFDYCELQIPFGKRGSIILLESSVNHGTLNVPANKRTLVWNIGSRFPARQGEVTMSAIIQLGTSQEDRPATLEEEFCTGQNAYAQLFFKISDYTQSGSAIDAKSIQVAPNMKFKLSCAREYLAGEYKFWNVHGDSLVSAVPRCLSDHALTSD
ncbi:AP-5 complex subunit mu-1-like [Mya arenaria]|uniref:AP-5 complex subunit mu-1-like n=1 Tax=Mya arenaria TaxID=6604 RepID=UPI0022DF8C86|nr:AP-5 complex subunit mu-1-like [Mya arenaria]